MKKFQFRFESVERLRKIKRDLQLKEFAEAQSRVSEKENEISEIKELVNQESERRASSDPLQEVYAGLAELSKNYKASLGNQQKTKTTEKARLINGLHRERKN